MTGIPLFLALTHSDGFHNILSNGIYYADDIIMVTDDKGLFAVPAEIGVSCAFPHLYGLDDRRVVVSMMAKVRLPSLQK